MLTAVIFLILTYFAILFLSRALIWLGVLTPCVQWIHLRWMYQLEAAVGWSQIPQGSQTNGPCRLIGSPFWLVMKGKTSQLSPKGVTARAWVLSLHIMVAQ